MELIEVGIVKETGDPATVMIHDDFIPALKDIHHFSHLLILWWLSENETKRNNLQDRPPFDQAPVTGVFASRSSARPNLIGLTVVKLLQVDYQKGLIHVDHMDGFVGSPVLDIKPYIPNSEHIPMRHLKIPDWFHQLNTPRRI